MEQENRKKSVELEKADKPEITDKNTGEQNHFTDEQSPNTSNHPQADQKQKIMAFLTKNSALVLMTIFLIAYGIKYLMES